MSELKSSNPVFSQRVFNRSNRGFNEQKPKPHTDDSAAIVMAASVPVRVTCHI